MKKMMSSSQDNSLDDHGFAKWGLSVKQEGLFYILFSRLRNKGYVVVMFDSRQVII